MRIRDFINEKMQKVEELAQYKEFTTVVSIVPSPPGTISTKRIHKFILHNGQERVIYEEGKCEYYSQKQPRPIWISNHASIAHENGLAEAAARQRAFSYIDAGNKWEQNSHPL